MGYLGIKNLYQCADILLFRELYAMEKIDGTSTKVIFKDGEVNFASGCINHEIFVKLFDLEFLKSKFAELFGNETVVIYGEGYAGKIQKMSATYGKDLKFIAFEVKVGGSWLNVPNAEDIVNKLKLEFVSYKKIKAEIDLIDAERDADSVQAVRNGMGSHIREGIVIRPLIELTKNNGERIIAKHKREEFSERLHVPKVIDAEKLKILNNAMEIAEEFVTHNRLEHVLQEIPHCTGIEHTQEVIKAMIADVYKEAKNEIVESKEASSAIGKKTAELWKKRIKNNFHETN